MTSKREQILSAITTALAGTTGLGSRIYRSRVEAFSRGESPALQQAVWLLLSNVTATQADVAELQGLLVANHLDGIYTLQPPAEN